jgi:hypothetical protein
MDGTGSSLITAFDYVWGRLTERLGGLTDEEYFWEPVPDVHYRNWRAGMAGLSPDGWAAPLGPSWGPYAESNTVDLALHVLDEVVHHGAETGLLRDLFARRSALGG